MEKKRQTRISVDLLNYKESWINWCKENKQTPSEAFRQIVARITQQKNDASQFKTTEKQQDNTQTQEQPYKRIQIALTAKELEELEMLAKKEGFSVSKWVVALVRAQLNAAPQFGQKELEVLAQSNLQLLKIGNNLNQIAKALNASFSKNKGVYKVEIIEKLDAFIKEHAKRVSGAMQSNIQKWRG